MAIAPTPSRILVIDDEVMVIDSLRQMLASFGYTVEVASNAEEAIAKFEPGRFNLVMVDYVMPGMKGDELAAVIKSQDPQVPIAMITALPERLRDAGALGAVDHIISKPLDLAEFRRTIAEILSKQ